MHLLHHSANNHTWVELHPIFGGMVAATATTSRYPMEKREHRRRLQCLSTYPHWHIEGVQTVHDSYRLKQATVEKQRRRRVNKATTSCATAYTHSP